MSPTTIALIGAPYTGKTALGNELHRRLPNSITMPEYARTYIEAYGPPEHPAEQMLMLRTNEMLERNLGSLFTYTIVDTPTSVYALYGRWLLAQRKEDSKIRKFRSAFSALAKKHANDHDLVLFLPCSQTMQYTEDNMDDVRVITPSQRSEIDEMLREFCVTYISRYHVIDGTLNNRVERVLTLIEAFNNGR